MMHKLLTSNGMTALPSEIALFPALAYLALDYNSLSTLPSEIVAMKGIGGLHICYLKENSEFTSCDLSFNQFTEIPEVFFNMPTLNMIYVQGNFPAH